ncbi:DUF294 nucleotidyltransferase-like domain-containing protein [Paenibacillus dakarensis]|uniref:DUF294 nucleotidyltransferase-like domain-containing protein n=1 Tax=Paenibacillus dakarensis TaxID=1527293 RepID=UPI0006D592D3|nr:DUF294 nucleotidyltransferase-like domain-containing protein [Paenibacillus dakarensis]
MEQQKYPNLIPDFSEIQNATGEKELRNARISCHHELLEMKNGTSLETWMAWVNRMHDEIARRAAVICELRLKVAGLGLPPARYAFVAFGSSARLEAALWSDQDHGLIIGDELEEKDAGYFQKFGTHMSNLLEDAGYRKCAGKVMCSEPMWRRSLSEWKKQLTDWSSEAAWESTRYLMIASDMRHIAGSSELSEIWLVHFRSCIARQPHMKYALLRNTVRHKATLNIMGRVVTERFGEHAGDFDVKYGMYIPLVNSIRAMALQRGITETSSMKRIERIIQLEGGNLLLENVQRALIFSLRMRAGISARIKDGLTESSDFLLKEELGNKTLQYELRDALGVVRRIHRSLQRELRFIERTEL